MAFLKVARRLLSMLSITSECQFSYSGMQIENPSYSYSGLYGDV